MLPPGQKLARKKSSDSLGLVKPFESKDKEQSKSIFSQDKTDKAGDKLLLIPKDYKDVESAGSPTKRKENLKLGRQRLTPRRRRES